MYAIEMVAVIFVADVMNKSGWNFVNFLKITGILNIRCIYDPLLRLNDISYQNSRTS